MKKSIKAACIALIALPCLAFGAYAEDLAVNVANKNPSYELQGKETLPRTEMLERQKFIEYENFVKNHVRDGLVFDENRMTSEGQSYMLFFALANGDRDMFEKVLAATEKYLCGGAFENNLPAWLYENGKIADDNNALDADLFIAYSLIEAARIFDKAEYLGKARAILSNVAQTSVYDHPVLGKLLIPGRRGFVSSNGKVTLNPSYYPPFIMARIGDFDPNLKVACQNTLAVTARAFGHGFAPDWISFTARGELIIDEKTIGSWDALRVALWYGITNKADPNRKILIGSLDKYLARVGKTLSVPDSNSMYFDSMNGDGGTAFMASAVPSIANSKPANYFYTIVKKAGETESGYYRSAITVFAEGYLNRYYGFDVQGRLLRNP